MKFFKRRNSNTQRRDQIAGLKLENTHQQNEKLPHLPEGSHVAMLVIQLAPLNNKSSSEDAMAFMAEVGSSFTGLLQFSGPPDGWSGKLSFLMPNGPADCGFAPVDITCPEPSWEISKQSKQSGEYTLNKIIRENEGNNNG